MTSLSTDERIPIRLTERGTWLHGNSPILPRVAKLFSRHLVPQPDGRYLIVLRDDVEEVAVADTAYFFEAMRLEEDDDGALLAVHLRVSDGVWEPLQPASLMLSDESVIYARVERHGLSVPCRFPTSLYHRLALHAEEESDGGFVLPIAGRRWPLRRYDTSPLPVDQAP